MRRDVNFDLIDWPSLRRRVGGDLGLLRDMLTMFAHEYPSMLDDLQQAIRRGDSPAAEKLSHKLKGSLVQFSAQAAAGTAARLEKMGKLNALDEAGLVLEQLRRELEELMVSLNALVSEGFS
jgi:histidine phosphotransfer protein HptB